MANISYYEISINFSTGNLMSVETGNTHVTFLLEYLNETNNTNITLLPKSLYTNYIITIVVYNSERMSSQSTSKSFGMKKHTQLLIK